MKKLNLSKPYGTVHGHDSAHFEQDGVLFDATGAAISEEKLEADAVIKAEALSAEQSAIRAFLSICLAGGPVDKSNVYKQAMDAELSWDSVKTEFAAVGLVETRGPAKTPIEIWRLDPEKVQSEEEVD